MQAIIQSGQPPTVLQQLCQLPFHYFSDPRLINVLFPTLISCCYNCQANREMLEQELSCDLLANFIEVNFTLVAFGIADADSSIINDLSVFSVLLVSTTW